jgi:small subunit ribosomal protein S16
MGRRHRPFFRINAVESRTPRDGRILEKLGHYDPIEKDPAKQVVLNRERVQYWLEKGAIPSDAVSEMLLHHGIKHKYAEQRQARLAKAKAIAKSKGKLFNMTERIAAKKQAEAAEEKAKAETETKAGAEATAAADTDAKAKTQTEAKAKAAEKKAKAESEVKAEVETEADAAQDKAGEKSKEESAQS